MDLVGRGVLRVGVRLALSFAWGMTKRWCARSHRRIRC